MSKKSKKKKKKKSGRIKRCLTWTGLGVTTALTGLAALFIVDALDLDLIEPVYVAQEPVRIDYVDMRTAFGPMIFDEDD